MRVGITLPQFRDESDPAIDAARRAEALGIDAVFCFDHLWPMGQPGRPAISSGPLLGALAASTSTITVGTLVARIGLLPDDVLVAELSSLATLSRGRLIAGMGTGDHLSRAENDAYGIPFEPASERRVRLASVAARVRDEGIPVWIGGGLPRTVELARTLSVAVNLWEGELMRVVIGDVSGKGLGAAMLVSAVVGALDTLHDSRPSAVLRALNGLLLARQQGGFATCGCACIAQDGAITLANAGHLAPYSNGEELPLESGLPLGIAAVAEYSETAFQLKSGDRLTLLSDGVVEAQSTSGELFGFDRTAAISVQSAEAIAAAAQAFGQEDDITVLTLTFEVLHA